VRPISNKKNWDFKKLFDNTDIQAIEREITEYVQNQFQEFKTSAE